MNVTVKFIINDVEYDVSAIVSLPLTITQTLDETLDTASISIPIVKEAYGAMDIDFSSRIERLTKCEITIDEETTRWRVAEDKVSVIKKSNPMLYSHVISLIEPTKLLERRVIPNMTITQPTGKTTFTSSTHKLDSYEIEGSLDGGNDANKQYLTLAELSDSTDTAKIDGTTLVESGREYAVSVSFNCWNDYFDTPLDDPDNYVLVELEIGGAVHAGDIYFKRIPHQTIGDRRRQYATISTTRLTASINEDVKVKVSALLPEAGINGNIHIDGVTLSISTKDYTDREQTFLDEVVDKMLYTTKISDLNDTSFSQEFTLGQYTRDKIKGVLSPELTFTKYTLWDGLKEISNIVKAIPRIGKNNWNEIEFDFIDEYNDDLEPYNLDDYIGLEKNAYLNDYVSGLIVNASNVVEIESSVNRKTEPYVNGWMSLRGNADGPVELREVNQALKLRQKIYRITKVLVRGIAIETDGVLSYGTTTQWDITPHIFEAKYFQALADEDFTSTADRQIGKISKGNSMFYQQGGDRILGMSSVGKYEETILNNKLPERALFEAVYSVAQKKIFDDGGTEIVNADYNISEKYFDGILFQVEYIPIQTIVGAVMRQDARSFETESLRYINEAAPVVDSNNLGEYAKATANKLGNEIRTYSGISTTLDSVPGIGRLIDTGEVVISSTLSVEKNMNSFSVDAYEDYSAISDYIGVNSAYRQWEVPDSDVVFRQDRYRDYLVVDKVDRVSAHSIYTEDALLVMLENFVTDTSTAHYTPASYGILRTRETAGLEPGDATWTTWDKEINLTVNTTNLGTTLLITTELENNFSAGPKMALGVTDLDYDGNPIANIADYDNIYYQQDVQYVDDFGQIDSGRITFYTYGDDVLLYNDTKQYPEFRALDSIDGLELSNIDVRMYKDAREKYGFVQELNFTSDRDDIRLYSGIAKYNGLSALNEEVSVIPCILLDGYFPNPNETIADKGRIIKTSFISSSVTGLSDINGNRAKMEISITVPTTTFSKTGYALINADTEELILAVNQTVDTTLSDTLFFVPNSQVGGYVDTTPTSIVITNTPTQLNIGDTFQLEYVLYPSYASSDVTWSVSNTTDWSIDANGLLTCIGTTAGTRVNVTTDIGAKTFLSDVIDAIPLISTGTISATKELIWMDWSEDILGNWDEVPETSTLSYTISPANAYDDTYYEILGTSLATLSGSTVTAKSENGTAILRLMSTSQGLLDSVNIEVRNAIHSITNLEQADPEGTNTIIAGGTYPWTYTYLPSDAYDDVEWSVTKYSTYIQIEVDASGDVTTVTDTAEGADYLVATSPRSGIWRQELITSVRPEPTSVTIGDVGLIDMGTSYQMTYTLTPSNAKDEGVTWGIQNPTDFTITTDGLITALPATSNKYCNVTISTHNGKTDTEYLGSTQPAPTSLYIYSKYRPYDISIPVLNTFKIELEDGNELDRNDSIDLKVDFTPYYANPTGTWSATAGTIEADGEDCVYTAPSTGQTVTITYTSDIDDQVLDTVELDIITPPPTSMSINTSSLNQNIAGEPWVNPNSSTQLSVDFLPTGTSSPVTWYLPDGQSGATLSSTGLYTPNGERDELVDASASLAGGPGLDEILISSVYDIPTSIDLNGLTVMSVGTSQQLTSTVTPVSGNPADLYVLVSGSSISVTSDGYVTALQDGVSTVRVHSAVDILNVLDTLEITVYTSGGGCLDRNTPILMADGTTRRIKTLKAGDYVLGFKTDDMIDEDIYNWEDYTTQDLETGQTIATQVKEIVFQSYDKYFLINNDLKITQEHPLFVKQDGLWQWSDARDVNVGDYLLGRDKEEIEITSIDLKEETLYTCNIDVESTDNYFAGKTPMLVHNPPLELVKA